MRGAIVGSQPVVCGHNFSNLPWCHLKTMCYGNFSFKIDNITLDPDPYWAKILDPNSMPDVQGHPVPGPGDPGGRGYGQRGRCHRPSGPEGTT